MFVVKQTHTSTHDFLPSMSTGCWRLWCWWRKETKTLTLFLQAPTQDVTATDCRPVYTLTRRQCRHEWPLASEPIHKNTAALPPQHVCVTWVTGCRVQQTQVRPSAQLPPFNGTKQLLHQSSFMCFVYLNSASAFICSVHSNDHFYWNENKQSCYRVLDLMSQQGGLKCSCHKPL